MKITNMVFIGIITILLGFGIIAQQTNKEKKMSNELKEGMKAPDFNAPSTMSENLALKDLKGSIIVLYFYPKDDTPGCTKEACSFRDANTEIQDLKVIVLGVSHDSIESHLKFKDKYKLNFPLLSDTSGKITEGYGITSRTTLLIDKKGIIRKIWRNVKVEGHAEEVLSEIKKILE